MPSLPAESIKTGAHIAGDERIANVADKAAVIHVEACDVCASTDKNMVLACAPTPPPVKEPKAMLPLPVVLLPSVAKPMAVFSLPVVLLKSAVKPMAVLSLPGGVMNECALAKGAVGLPSGIGRERVSTKRVVKGAGGVR